MNKFWISKPFSLVLTIAVTVIITACGGAKAKNGVLRIYQDDVDLRFREFYDWLGGVDNLGPAISPKFSHGGYEYQYTAAALMVYIPNLENSQRYQLAPLGMELGIAEPPMNPDTPSGHEVYPGFLVMYNQMGGERYVGLPITEARYNADKKRIEQFFENVGFYHLDSDNENVHLLHYGAWKCAEHCGFDSPSNAEIVVWASVGSSFEFAVQRLDPRFTGYPLTESYTSFDGELEQIFENVVIQAKPNNPGNIEFKPIVEMIGIPTEKSGKFTIPDFFLEFIERNSGFEFSGQPVSEFTALSSEVYRQCFTNLCLDYYPNSSKELKVRPAPLGYTYKSLYYLENDSNSIRSQSKSITLNVWEKYPLLPRDQQQEIGVKIDSGDSMLNNFEPVLTLNVANVGEIKYTFPRTNKDGTSILILDKINAINGTRIEYEVCVKSVSNERYCVTGDFMLWGE